MHEGLAMNAQRARSQCMMIAWSSAVLLALSACAGERAGPAPSLASTGAGSDAQPADASAETGESADSKELGKDTGGNPDGSAADAVDAAGPATATTCKSDKQCAAIGQICDTASSLCVDCLGPADCPANWTCKAHNCIAPASPCTTSKQCPTGQLCAKGLGLCVECAETGDCEGGLVCVENACSAQVCKPGEQKCTADGDRATCSPDGGSWTLELCPEGEVCDGGQCLPVVCKPQESQCAGTAVAVCNASGTGLEPAIPCPANHFCKAGACLPAQCQPGWVQCSGNAVDTCLPDGSGYASSPCPSSQICHAGACATMVCAPGSLGCSNGMATKCDAFGLSWVLVQDCPANGLKCSNGACVAGLACAPGQIGCAGPVALTCKPDGTWAESLCVDGNPCTADGCVPATGQCQFNPEGAIPCSDGDVCTVQDKCAGTKCAGGAPMVCDDGNPCTADSCVAGQGCKFVPQTKQLVDIVIWIDTSGSMSQEAAWVNQNIVKFMAILGQKSFDYRVVLFGTGLGLCSSGCPTADKEHFLWVQQPVSSTNGPTLLSTATQFNKFKSFLRPGASHHIVAISDDNCSMMPGTFVATYEGLLKGAGLVNKFIYHSVVSFINAADPKQAGNCTGGAAYGSFHVNTSALTGGSAFQICQQDWTVLFEKLANSVAGAVAGCAPPP